MQLLYNAFVTKNIEQIIELVKSKTKILFILCGLPYSGKTYVAKKIVAATQCAFVSIDDIFHAHGYDWNTNTLPDEKGWAEIFEISYDQTRDALRKSKTVLYDSTNHTRASRDELRAVAEKSDAEVVVLLIDVPEEVVYSRREKNVHNHTSSIVSKELVGMTVAAFERPREDERVVIFSNEARR